MTEDSETLGKILDLCRRGKISPQIALSRLLLAGEAVEPGTLARHAADDPGSAALAALARLAAHHAENLPDLHRLARSGLWPAGSDILSETAALFDRLAVEAPEAGVAFYSLGDAIDAALDTLFDLHGARWAQAGQPGVLADPRIRAFHRAAAPALAEAGLLRIAVVRHDGRIVAVLYGLADGARWHSYINAVDMTVPGQSFGTLAFACLIEAAAASGAGEFHFLRGDEPYKSRWGAVPIHTVRRRVRRA